MLKHGRGINDEEYLRHNLKGLRVMLAHGFRGLGS